MDKSEAKKNKFLKFPIWRVESDNTICTHFLILGTKGQTLRGVNIADEAIEKAFQPKRED